MIKFTRTDVETPIQLERLLRRLVEDMGQVNTSHQESILALAGQLESLRTAQASLESAQAATSSAISQSIGSTAGISYYDEENNQWISSPGASATQAGLVTTGDQTWAGNKTFTGNVDIQGNTTLGADSSTTVTMNSRIIGDLVPNVDDTYDIGKPGYRWQDLYLSGDIEADDITCQTLLADSAISCNGDVNLASNSALYWGDKNTNGSWRMLREGDDLLAQKRVSGAWPQKSVFLPHGGMYANNIAQVVVVAATDTFYNVGGGLSDGGNSAAFTFQNSRELLCNIAGFYMVTWSMTLDINAALQTAEGCVGINGASQANTTNHTHASTANDEASCGGTGFLTLAVGDLVTLMVSNHSSTQDITVEHANLTMIHLA